MKKIVKELTEQQRMAIKKARFEVGMAREELLFLMQQCSLNNNENLLESSLFRNAEEEYELAYLTHSLAQTGLVEILLGGHVSAAELYFDDTYYVTIILPDDYEIVPFSDAELNSEDLAV